VRVCVCVCSGAITVSQYIYEVEHLLVDDGVFIIISHGNPEEILPFLEQYDIDEPYYTPWLIDVQAIGECARVKNVLSCITNIL
jgi:hypothetical protein